jgi:transcriptional regulator with XRE-family HTH domain
MASLASAPPTEQDRGARSPFRAARLRRRLSVEDAARRAAIPPEHVEWLEEGRVYRFPSTDAALSAALVLAAALDVDLREARGLTGLPAPRVPLWRRPRLMGALAVILAAGAFAAALLVPEQRGDAESRPDPVARAAATLPPRWNISVDVLNGAGDIVRTRQVASQIGALAYTIRRVGRADRFDYPQTAVYYERGGRLIAIRLAREIGVVTMPLPGGTNRRRLVVVVGPPRGPGQ